MRLRIVAHICIWGVFCAIFSSLQAQGIPENLPPGVPANAKERILQLRKEGLSDDAIRKRIEQELRKRGTSVPQQNTPSPANPNSASQGNTAANQADAASTPNNDDAADNNMDNSAERDTSDVNNEQYVSPLDLENMVYGQHIFLDPGIRFDLDQGTEPADDYLVGPGDKFTVTVWGVSEMPSHELTVDARRICIQRFIGKNCSRGKKL